MNSKQFIEKLYKHEKIPVLVQHFIQFDSAKDSEFVDTKKEVRLVNKLFLGLLGNAIKTEEYNSFDDSLYDVETLCDLWAEACEDNGHMEYAEYFRYLSGASRKEQDEVLDAMNTNKFLLYAGQSENDSWVDGYLGKTERFIILRALSPTESAHVSQTIKDYCDL